MKVSGGDVHEKWSKFLDTLTIAGHSHQTAAELCAEITDHMPLLNEVSDVFGYVTYSVYVSAVTGLIIVTNASRTVMWQY